MLHRPHFFLLMYYQVYITQQPLGRRHQGGVICLQGHSICICVHKFLSLSVLGYFVLHMHLFCRMCDHICAKAPAVSITERCTELIVPQ